MTCKEKYEALKNGLKTMERVAVAFSGGVDSTLLLKVAADVLGSENVIAISARSPAFPERESEEARAFCASIGVERIDFYYDQLSVEGFRENPPDRCYICKKAIFNQIIAIAEENGFSTVCEGTNADDLADYRPGINAIKELSVKSPLLNACLTKAEIRELLSGMGLSAAKKPALACLATRFATGDAIDEERLSMVERAEQYLFDNGFSQYRVRVHGEGPHLLARIEIKEEEFPRMMQDSFRKETADYFAEIGFLHVSLDISGYRTGSMNIATDQNTT